MSDDKNRGPNTPIFVGGTIAYLISVVGFAYSQGYFDPSGTPIEPGEWGSVLAGMFAPLAFLWLLYAALAQRAELELQREELRRNNKTQELQHAAMERQGEALAAQAKLLEAQALAAFDPIFTISRVFAWGAGADKKAITYILNSGADIIDVEFDGLGRLEELNGSPDGFDTDDGLVYIWKSGHEVAIATYQPDMYKVHELQISFTRKDGLRKESFVTITLHDQRLTLLRSVATDLP